MFDIGFSELMLIALVALIVLGPERLPRVARTAGHLMGRMRRYVSDVKSDIDREMQIEELKKMQQQLEASARGMQTALHDELSGVENSIHKAAGLNTEESSDPSVYGDELTEPPLTPKLRTKPRTRSATGSKKRTESAAPDVTGQSAELFEPLSEPSKPRAPRTPRKPREPRTPREPRAKPKAAD